MLTELFNKCLKESCFPDYWKVSLVLPVFTNIGQRSAAMHLRHWIPNTEVPRLKPLGCSKVDSAFHPSKVGKMSTGDFRELSGKK